MKIVSLLAGLALAVPIAVASAQGAEHGKLNVGVVGGASATYWDIYAAQELGYFRDAGVEVVVTSIDTGSQTAQALLTGAVQLASVPAEVAISAIEKGARLSIVGAENAKPHFSFVARAGIEDYEQLRGKTIAVSQLAEAGATILRELLASKGLQPGEYNVIQLGGNRNRMTGLIKGAIDATFLSPPLDFRAEAEVGARRLGYLYEVFPYPYMVFAVQTAWADQHPDAVAGFLAATLRSSRWLQDPANRQQAIDVLVRVGRASLDDATSTYDFFFGPGQILSPDGEFRPEHVQAYLDLRGGGPLAPEAFLDPSHRSRALRALP